jgi:3-oxoadipate enol-lactonase / 4-carboxymuconolactone decarboxylase
VTEHSAQPLVLLNAIGTTTAIWDGVIGPLAERLRVIRVDTRGHGDAPPAHQPCTIADLGRDVLAALDEHGVERAHLAGVSLGGMVAIWLAAHRPERVARLALLSTSAHLPAARWHERAATVRRGGMAAIAGPVVAAWITPALAARDPELVARLTAMLQSTDPESYALCCEAIAGTDLRADLPRISAPTMVIAGTRDQAIPVEHAHTIANDIAIARLSVLPDAAHIPTLEQAGPTAVRLLEHFTGGEATRRAVLGDAHVNRATEHTSEFTAPFQDFLTRYAWGEVWTRPGLPRRERSLITLAVLTALGAEHELDMHVRGALSNGVSPEEIREVLLHTAVYAGLPRANRAFAIADDVLHHDGSRS